MNNQPAHQPHVWGAVPPRNPDFTGREELLARLRALLTEPADVTNERPAALHGIGGAGKTQVVVEYLYRYAHEYDIVWWIPSEDPAHIWSSLAELAGRLDVDFVGAETEVLAALRRGLRHHRWIVVFDNAEFSELLDAFPPFEPGHVVLTSRGAGWDRLARMIEVTPFRDRAHWGRLARMIGKSPFRDGSRSEPTRDHAVARGSAKALRVSVFKADSDAVSVGGLTPAMGLAMDTVGYGSKSPSAQQDVQERLPAVMHRVLADIGLQFDELPSATSGDGLYLFLPPGTDPTWALPCLLPAMAVRLTEDNERYRDQLRVRMSLGFGLHGRGKLGLIGRLVIDLTRLIDSPAIRRAVLDHPKSDLVVLVSRELYELVSSTKPLVPGGQVLSRVAVEMKEYEGAAWLWTSPPRR